MDKNIIERAYELAPGCGNLDEVRNALVREGYSSVDAHLSGPKIRSDLTKLLTRPLRTKSVAKAIRSLTSAVLQVPHRA